MVCLSTLFSAVILQHCVRWLIATIFQENNPLPSISLMTCSLFSFFKHSKPALKIILTEDWPVKIVLSHSPGNRDGGLNSPSIERGKTAIVITTQNSDEWVWKIHYLLDNSVVCDIKFTIFSSNYTYAHVPILGTQLPQHPPRRAVGVLYINVSLFFHLLPTWRWVTGIAGSYQLGLYHSSAKYNLGLTENTVFGIIPPFSFPLAHRKEL